MVCLTKQVGNTTIHPLTPFNSRDKESTWDGLYILQPANMIIFVQAEDVMKRRDIVLEKLKDNAGELQRFHVSALSLFGSVVRGEEGPGSDVDLLVEFNEPVGMFTFIRLKNHLEKLLGAKVDLVTPEALKERLSDRILKEAIRAA